MTSAATTTAPSNGLAAARSRSAGILLAAGRDQAVVAAGQLLAGLGNLAFVAVAARVLAPAEFGHLAAFIALLTLLHLPAAGLAAAGAASSPTDSRRLWRRSLWAGVAAGAALTAAAGPLAAVVGLPSSLLLALAWAAPAAPLLGLQRGLAYRERDHRSVVASLLAEPAARLLLGLGLASTLGAAGAAWGAAAGGWLALLAMHALAAPAAGGAATTPGASTARRAGATGLAFVGLAILQHQDLVLANRVLDGTDAGAFAALSAVGGLVAFATATLPLVLLPASQRQQPGSLAVAAGTALAVAVGAFVVAVAAAAPLLTVIAGPRYDAWSPLVTPYVGAMGALGVARVLAAHRCGTGASRRAAWAVGAAAVLQAAGIVAFARTPGQVVAVSTVALVGVASVMAVPAVWQPAAPEGWRGRAAVWLAGPDARLVGILTIAAIVLRLATERSFWIDEAISVRQAQLPFGEMLENLRSTDVHPPLHHLVLWVTSRVLGTAEWAMRLPSVLFGAALVPALYGAAREAFDARTARVVAVLAVPAPFLVWYSQEARMYSLFMLAGVCGVWAQMAAVRSGRTAAWVAWGAASAALIWTQWFALLPLAVQHAAMVVQAMRVRRAGRSLRPLLRGWLISVGATVALVAPLVPFLLDQLAAYGERGAGLSMPSTAGTDSSTVVEGLSSYALIANLVWALGGYHSDAVMTSLGALWPLAMLGCLLLLGRRLQPGSRLLLAVALVPGALLYLIGHTKRDLFELRYFVLAAPLLLVLVARGVTSATRTRLATGLLTGALVVVSTVGLVDQQLNGTNPRLYDFRGAVAEIERTAQPGDALAYAPDYLDGVLAYYAPDLEGMPLGAVDPADIEGQIYVVVSERFLTEATAGPVGDVLAGIEAERGRPERIERPNVIVWRFS